MNNINNTDSNYKIPAEFLEQIENNKAEKRPSGLNSSVQRIFKAHDDVIAPKSSKSLSIKTKHAQLPIHKIEEQHSLVVFIEQPINPQKMGNVYWNSAKADRLSKHEYEVSEVSSNPKFIQKRVSKADTQNPQVKKVVKSSTSLKQKVKEFFKLAKEESVDKSFKLAEESANFGLDFSVSTLF